MRREIVILQKSPLSSVQRVVRLKQSGSDSSVELLAAGCLLGTKKGYLSLASSEGDIDEASCVELPLVRPALGYFLLLLGLNLRRYESESVSVHQLSNCSWTMWWFQPSGSAT